MERIKTDDLMNSGNFRKILELQEWQTKVKAHFQNENFVTSGLGQTGRQFFNKMVSGSSGCWVKVAT